MSSPTARVVAKTIEHGGAHYRVDTEGSWWVLMFGWWPDSGGTPSHRWRPIPSEKVPGPVRDLA